MYKHNKSNHSLLFALLLLPCCALAQGTGTSESSCPDTGQGVLQVDSNRSQADILVRKAGFLKRFGHDHVIQARSIEGYVYWPDDLQDACGVLTFNVESLVVDDPVAREKYQLDTKPSTKDIARTRDNMLSKVLESDRWPNVSILLTYAGGEFPNLEVTAIVEMHGMRGEIAIPVLIGKQASGYFISGEMDITQSDFGITPFSAVGGGLKIENKLQISFNFVLK